MDQKADYLEKREKMAKKGGDRIEKVAIELGIDRMMERLTVLMISKSMALAFPSLHLPHLLI